MLSGKCVVVGVTGGIAAYKSCELVSRLKKLHADVYVIMTQNACEFVQPLTFQSLSHNPVSVDTFSNVQHWEIEHIALAQRADLFAIAPATANVIGKLACGIADDMLSTTAMATCAPLLLAPAMNTAMWESAAVQANMRVLLERGVKQIGPASGMLACGDVGAGKMSEPEEIVAAICGVLCPKRDFEGRKVLVTAGPTREALDPVRYITNRSSGKMGYNIAAEAAARGAQVTLVSGPVNIPAPRGVKLVRVQSTQDLYNAMLELAPAQDVLIQAAAPADFRAAEIAPEKIKRVGDTLTLTLIANPDVAATVGRLKRTGQVFVGFAAETQSVLENASGKLERKNLDLMVANDVTKPGAGFDVDTNIITLITRNSTEELPLMSKAEAAARILDCIAQLM